MNSLTTRPTHLLILPLTLLMATTRLHHFGSALNLPDASLAVFFLAGFYLPSAGYFPALLVEAALIDYLAINVGGVSGWCVSPAYAFLLPTYACLWYGGRWYAKQHQMSWRSLTPLLGIMFVATSAAFLISNGSFYLFSGRFQDMDWSGYALRVAHYYRPYVGSTVGYVALAGVLHVLWAASARNAEGVKRTIQP